MVDCETVSKNGGILRDRLLEHLWKTKREPPDLWGAQNVRFRSTTGQPGAFDPELTPYMRSFARAFGDAARWKIIVQIISAQSGKTLTGLCVIGERLDNRPVPTVYVGPNQDFFRTQFEPRFVEMLESCGSLPDKRYGVIYADIEARFEVFSRETGMDRAPVFVNAARLGKLALGVDCQLRGGIPSQ